MDLQLGLCFGIAQVTDMSIYSKFNRPIVIVDYDSRWPSLYDAERQKLNNFLGDYIVDIEHIGSTAVPELAAKPVIDIAIGLAHIDNASDCIAILEQNGYSYEPALEAALPDRRFLWRISAEGQRYHLSLAWIMSLLWINPILFRDYLRSQPEAAREYGRLKEELANKCGTEIGAYIAGKTSFIEKVLTLARAEDA
jgi:GrpB-like predicted nucleotidyltransferase (UPF0157 family)